MSRVVNFPVGDEPGWELEDEELNPEAAEVHTIAYSKSLYQSLKQSREQWVSSTFPKFFKARSGKHAAAAAPPHDLISYGRFDLVIGPHIFFNTRLSEVRYVPQQMNTPAPPQPSYQQGPMSPSSSTSTPQPIESTPHAQASTANQVIVVTSAHAEAVHQMASKDPELQMLLQKAYTKNITPEEHIRLAYILRSLEPVAPAPVPYQPAQTAPPPPPPVPQTYVREFDIVVEFQEKPSERWRIPRTVAYLERVDVGETILTISLPFPDESAAKSTDASRQDDYVTPIPTQLARLRWGGLSEAAIQLLSSWCGGDNGIAENKEKLANVKLPKTIYIPHQLSDGELLQAVHAALIPFNMKPVKPANADSGRTRRRSSVRKRGASQTTKDTNSVVVPPIPLATPNSASSPARQDPQSVAPNIGPIAQNANLQPSNTTSMAPSHLPGPTSSAADVNDASSEVRPISQQVADVFEAPSQRASTPVEFIGKPRPQYPPSAHVYDPSTGTRIPVTSLAAIVSPRPEPATPQWAYAGDRPPPRFTPVPQVPQPQKRSYAPEPHMPDTASVGETSAPPTKRKRAYQRKEPHVPAVIISCRACGQTNVPLLKGGRYCRACIDAGRATEPIPEVSPRSAHYAPSTSRVQVPAPSSSTAVYAAYPPQPWLAHPHGSPTSYSASGAYTPYTFPPGYTDEQH